MILNSVRQQLFTSNIIPLKLSFAADKIVYPLRISQITAKEDELFDNAPYFVNGKQGKALRLTKNQMLTTDQIVRGFSINNGSINFSLKKRTFEEIGKILEIQIPGNKNNIYQKIEIENYSENIFVFRVYADSNYFVYQIDLGSDFKKNQWQDYNFSWQKI